MSPDIKRYEERDKHTQYLAVEMTSENIIRPIQAHSANGTSLYLELYADLLQTQINKLDKHRIPDTTPTGRLRPSREKTDIGESWERRKEELLAQVDILEGRAFGVIVVDREGDETVVTTRKMSPMEKDWWKLLTQSEPLLALAKTEELDYAFKVFEARYAINSSASESERVAAKTHYAMLRDSIPEDPGHELTDAFREISNYFAKPSF